MGDFFNNRCQIFDRQGNFRRAFGADILSAPTQVFVDTDDVILVSSYEAIEVFASDGAHLKTIGRGVVDRSSGVCMDLAGKIFVTNVRQHNVIAF